MTRQAIGADELACCEPENWESRETRQVLSLQNKSQKLGWKIKLILVREVNHEDFTSHRHMKGWCFMWNQQ